MDFLNEKKLTCLLPFGNLKALAKTAEELKGCKEIKNIFIVHSGSSGVVLPDGCQGLPVGFLHQTRTWKTIVSYIDTPYTLLYTQTLPLQLGAYAVERMLHVIADMDAGMLYADRYKLKEGLLQPHPTNDYQEGSLRDDFDFGPLLLFQSSVLKDAVSEMDVEYEAAALYDLRLKISKYKSLFHLPEFLYTESETDFRPAGEKQFDYVDPKNRQVQIEMEQACTRYLKDTGAWLKPVFTPIEFTEETFPVEATVVIPVRNREKTIEAAVRSVLMQETDFPFNLIVTDNHSTDKTTEILKKIASGDRRLIHLIPDRKDLGIGGCWNEAVMHPQCGKFVIQLDSDDLYIDKQVIQTIVNAFYEQNCAMLVGTYQMVNFQLEEIPPGIIDHKEWTPDNGRNNALRINGLGAPRAFYTPVLREIKIPNTSYGEDYAVGLAVSRNYRIGRIYQPLYLCRRWEDNSDASSDIDKLNAHNRYKDCIRTIELQARKNKNRLENK
ncbi:MAG: glycosyltransferase family 2 protein [Candidatus Azobacteroides sp.]|nr:glycosyltransferase family 2 protein [Candidatus Azobacteroides sp.]